jgi:hypothetical protein
MHYFILFVVGRKQSWSRLRCAKYSMISIPHNPNETQCVNKIRKSRNLMRNRKVCWDMFEEVCRKDREYDRGPSLHKSSPLGLFRIGFIVRDFCVIFYQFEIPTIIKTLLGVTEDPKTKTRLLVIFRCNMIKWSVVEIFRTESVVRIENGESLTNLWSFHYPTRQFSL